MIARLEALGDRLVTLPRARAHAAVVLTIFALVYAVGLARARGLVDGFGHVIGSDLLMERAAAAIVLDGAGDRLYDFDLQMAYQQAEIAPEPLRGLDPFVAPPVVPLLYAPLARVPHALAFAMWAALAFAALAGALALLARRCPALAANRGGALLLTLSFFPVIEGLLAGSNTTLAPLVLTAAFLALESGHDVRAGVLLGCAPFRPQILPATLAVLAYKRRWRALAGFAGMAALWALLSATLVSRGSLAAWLHMVPQVSRWILEPGMPTPLLSSVYALFVLPLGAERLGPAMAMGSIASLGLLILLLRLWAGPWEPGTARFDLRIAALFVVTPLVSPYLMLHDLGILIVPAALVTEYWVGRVERRGWGLVRLAFAAVWVASFLGPAVAVFVPVAIVPLAVLLMGGAVLFTLRHERQATRRAAAGG